MVSNVHGYGSIAHRSLTSHSASFTCAFCLLAEYFQSQLLSFSPNLDYHNPDIPEWRQDIGNVIKKALVKVSRLYLWFFETKKSNKWQNQDFKILFQRKIRIIYPYRERYKEKSELGKEEQKEETWETTAGSGIEPSLVSEEGNWLGVCPKYFWDRVLTSWHS